MENRVSQSDLKSAPGGHHGTVENGPVGRASASPTSDETLHRYVRETKEHFSLYVTNK